MENGENRNTAIKAAQLRQLLSVSRVSLATRVALATILAYMQREVIDPQILAAWCVFMGLTVLLRAATIIAYQRTPVKDDAAIHVRLTRFRLGVMLAGQIWGSAGFLLFPAHDPQHQMFLIFTLAGMTAGGVISFSADLLSAVVFSVSMTLPLMARLFWEGDSSSVAMGLAVVFYVGFMFMTLRRISRATLENIVLHLDAASREKLVRESEERYRLLLNHSPVGIIHYDTNFIITYCNDHLVDMLHSPIERVIGLDMKQLRTQAILPPLKKALGGERSYYEGHYSATVSDVSGWIAMTCAPL